MASPSPTTAQRLALSRLLLRLPLLLLLLLQRTIDHRGKLGGAMRPMEQVAGLGGRHLLSGNRQLPKLVVVDLGKGRTTTPDQGR